MSLNKHVIHTFLTQIPSILLGIVAGIFITRLLGPEGRGIYYLFQVNIQFATLLLGASLTNGLIYYMANKQLDQRSLLGISLYVLIFSTAVVLLGTALIMSVFSDWKKHVFPIGYDTLFYAAYFSASFFLTILNTIVSGFLQGRKHFGSVNTIALLNGALNLACFGIAFLIYQLFGTTIGVKEIFVIAVGILLLNTLLWLYFYARHIRILPTMVLSWNKVVKPFSSYTGLGHVSNVLNFLNYRFDIWVVSYYCDFTQVGFYGLAVNIGQFLWMISTPISSVLLPYLSESNVATKMTMLRLYSRLNGTASILGAVLIFLLCDTLVPLVYGEEFSPSTLPLKILLIGIVFSSLTKPFASYLASNNMIRHNLIATIFGLIATIFFDLYLVPRMGIVGASWATVIAYVAVFLYVYWAMSYKAGMVFGNYFWLTREDIKTFIGETKK